MLISAQGAGAVPRPLARVRPGQRLPDLQRADQPAVHAAHRRRSSLDHHRFDRRGHLAHGEPEFSVNSEHLLEMPAGAGRVCGGRRIRPQTRLKQEVDPLLARRHLLSVLHNTAANGSRNHFGAGVEFSDPDVSSVEPERGDALRRVRYSGNASGKVTYTAASNGARAQPAAARLVGTGFRAPDLSYLYAGQSGSSSGGSDYYCAAATNRTRRRIFVDDCTTATSSFNGRSHGSTALKDETSKSFTYGFVYSPTAQHLDFTADYYIIKPSATKSSTRTATRSCSEEADCRAGSLDTELGVLPAGHQPGSPAIPAQRPEQSRRHHLGAGAADQCRLRAHLGCGLRRSLDHRGRPRRQLRLQASATRT